ncbi:host attachment protein [Sphingomonas sp. MMS24-J13]|uniref:host attachment protein n=1 Tax=Sphingomonas sp. MMS24-J13 TaxID=3238686 RepID=UPI00384D453D
MLVPHGAHVLAVDGGRMHLLRNRGRDSAIDLETIAERHLDNPRTHVLSEAQPGRSFQSYGTSRSAYEGTDTHQLREDAFCEAALDQALAAAGEAGELVLIAPPRVMGLLRRQIERHQKRPAIREVVKDLAALAPKDLADHLNEYR